MNITIENYTAKEALKSLKKHKMPKEVETLIKKGLSEAEPDAKLNIHAQIQMPSLGGNVTAISLSIVKAPESAPQEEPAQAPETREEPLAPQEEEPNG